MKKTNKKEIDQLKTEIESDNWKRALNASDRLAEIGGRQVVDLLIGFLESNNSITRNAAALAISELKDNKAKEPLKKAILKQENLNNRGTLISALMELDCSDLFELFFNIALYGNAECSLKALIAFEEKFFKVETYQIESALKELDKYSIIQKNKPDDWELLVDDLKHIINDFSDRTEE